LAENIEKLSLDLPHGKPTLYLPAYLVSALWDGGRDIIHQLLESVEWCKSIGHQHALTSIHTALRVQGGATLPDTANFQDP